MPLSGIQFAGSQLEDEGCTSTLKLATRTGRRDKGKKMDSGNGEEGGNIFHCVIKLVAGSGSLIYPQPFYR